MFNIFFLYSEPSKHFDENDSAPLSTYMLRRLFSTPRFICIWAFQHSKFRVLSILVLNSFNSIIYHSTKQTRIFTVFVIGKQIHKFLENFSQRLVQIQFNTDFSTLYLMILQRTSSPWSIYMRGASKQEISAHVLYSSFDSVSILF